jgi:3-dehydroquinate synthase
MRAGLAEVIKYGVIGDADLFGYLEENLDSVSRREFDPLRFVVKRSCQIKASVITQDEREKDLRMILNFGHTLGHAIEAATDYRLYRHGEAVSIGMIYATDIAVRMDVAPEETLIRIRGLLERSGLPTGCQRIDPDEIMAFLHQDKKVRDNRVRFVLPLGIGKVTVTDAVTERLIRKVLQENEI